MNGVILREDFMIPGLTTVHENGLCGGSRRILEGRGFSSAVRALTHHFVVPPLPLAGEGSGGEGVASHGGAEAPPFHCHFHGRRKRAGCSSTATRA